MLDSQQGGCKRICGTIGVLTKAEPNRILGQWFSTWQRIRISDRHFREMQRARHQSQRFWSRTSSKVWTTAFLRRILCDQKYSQVWEILRYTNNTSLWLLNTPVHQSLAYALLHIQYHLVPKPHMANTIIKAILLRGKLKHRDVKLSGRWEVPLKTGLPTTRCVPKIEPA